jgi:uncharacterized membrane protein
MVKAKLSFFQMQIKRMLRHAVKLCQSSLSTTPKRLNAIDMPLTIGELILAMIHPKMLIKANIHQTIIATPAIRMNYAADIDMTARNALQRGFGAVWHNFRIHFTWRLSKPNTIVLP